MVNARFIWRPSNKSLDTNRSCRIVVLRKIFQREGYIFSITFSFSFFFLFIFLSFSLLGIVKWQSRVAFSHSHKHTQTLILEGLWIYPEAFDAYIRREDQQNILRLPRVMRVTTFYMHDAYNEANR